MNTKKKENIGCKNLYNIINEYEKRSTILKQQISFGVIDVNKFEEYVPNISLEIWY